MSTVYYTSDIHLNHRLVSSLRGFYKGGTIGVAPEDPRAVPAETFHHDSHIAANWDRVVKADDHVHILGDMSIKGGQYVLDWIAARPGVKHLYSGNHDPVHPMFSSHQRILPQWLEVFDTIQPFGRRKFGDQEVLLSHFPYMPYDRVEPRYAQYRLPDYGLPLIHGHVHSSEKFEYPRQMHVGLDAWNYELVPQERVEEWVKSIVR